jgi:hypothetical protein
MFIKGCDDTLAPRFDTYPRYRPYDTILITILGKTLEEKTNERCSCSEGTFPFEIIKAKT